MNKLKQNAEILVEVCEHYDKNASAREKLKTQIVYLLAAINKNMKEDAK
jgi:hypothetical protein